ncbi:MAG: hypothetical protein O7F17_01095 [Planctomycetota bacterium]|nr:hypothetical protein [Planctomycetota bacterium]MCZ6493744.1 hypothetical protein [Planctomycetota bacterium]MCZ6543239.1 hypothetical protein [Planctomycetota bacterium]MCZ6653837.1 hypothetical protein [Planctomycetota bacterium]MCZ6736068.1 hypothetical protein [Planctomycetota bacterium]
MPSDLGFSAKVYRLYDVGEPVPAKKIDPSLGMISVNFVGGPR